MSEEDHETTIILREGGALVPIEDHLLPRGGWFLIGCEDGDRTPEGTEHLRKKLRHINGERVCTQLPHITGGPASASPHCPFFHITYQGKHVARGDELLFARIEKGLIAKGDSIRNIGYKPHCACGMCTEMGVTLWDNLRHSFETKELVQKEFRNVFKYQALLPHLDFRGHLDEPRPFRTYHCNKKKFEKLWNLHTATVRTPKAA